MSRINQIPQIPLPAIPVPETPQREPWRKWLFIAVAIVIAGLLIINEFRIAAQLKGEVTGSLTMQMLIVQRIVSWIAALGTLAVYSFLFKDNAFYQGFEFALLGCATGMGAAIVCTDVLVSKWWKPMMAGFSSGQISGMALLLPGLLGLLWYFQFSKKSFWLSRIPMVIGLGAGAGLSVKDVFNSLVPQITGSFKTLWPGDLILPGAGSWERAAMGFENLVYVVGTITVLMYFFFAFGRKSGQGGVTSKIGRWYLMLALGVFFGNTFMSRLSALIERIHFLFSEWLRLSAA